VEKMRSAPQSGRSSKEKMHPLPFFLRKKWTALRFFFFEKKFKGKKKR
jgi:hypothetical protein